MLPADQDKLDQLFVFRFQAKADLWGALAFSASLFHRSGCPRFDASGQSAGKQEGAVSASARFIHNILQTWLPEHNLHNFNGLRDGWLLQVFVTPMLPNVLGRQNGSLP